MDGYVLCKNSRIVKVGEYSAEKGREIVDNCGDNLTILGEEHGRYKSGDPIPRIKGIILPGFVKAHGHDHETPLIGMAKDTTLTEWLDRAVNAFTEFLLMKEKELQDIFKQNPYLIMYLKARLDNIQFGITSDMVHHCNFPKYHVPELVEANRIAGTKMIIAVGGSGQKLLQEGA